jgi:hypothetical protein
LQVLADVKCAFKHRNALLNSGQIEILRSRVDRGFKFHGIHRVDDEINRFIAFRPRRIHMYIRREAHFRSQRYATARKARAVGLPDGQLEMRRLYVVGHLFAEFRKQLRNYVVSRKPFPVFCFEEFLANRSVRIDEEITRTRHAVKLPCGFDVQNVICTNDFRIGVGKQRKVDFAAIRKIFQYGLGVVANGSESDSLLRESRFGVLQLDQLPFAVGSPIGGAKEKENRAVRTFETFKCLFAAELIRG